MCIGHVQASWLLYKTSIETLTSSLFLDPIVINLLLGQPSYYNEEVLTARLLACRGKKNIQKLGMIQAARSKKKNNKVLRTEQGLEAQGT